MTPRKKIEIVHVKSCNIVNFGWKMVLKHFTNGNASVPMRSGSVATIGTAFPRVSPRNGSGL